MGCENGVSFVDVYIVDIVYLTQRLAGLVTGLPV